MFGNDDCYELLTNTCQNPNTRNLFSHTTMYKSGISKEVKDPDILFFTMKLMLQKFEDSNHKTVPTAEEIKALCIQAKNSLDVEAKTHEYLAEHGIEEKGIPQHITNMLNNMLNVI
jgi:hypothetical protein